MHDHERQQGILAVIGALVAPVVVLIKDLVAAAGLGESIYIDQITAPAGCEFVYKNRFPVMLVARKRGATDDSEK